MTHDAQCEGSNWNSDCRCAERALAQAQGEIERLKEEAQKYGVMYSLENALRKNVCEERDALRAQIARLTAALKRYGAHRRGCEFYSASLLPDGHGAKAPGDCTCGFAALTEPGGQP